MTEKRYYTRDFEELYYIIDSHKISEKEFDEKVMYDGYSAFEDSLTGEEIVELLNKNEELREQVKCLLEDLQSTNQINKEIVDDVREELLKENEQLKNKMLDVLKENEQLNEYTRTINKTNTRLKSLNYDLENGHKELLNENEQLKQFKDNVFDLIDKNIKEIKELFEDGKIDLISYNSAMITLIGLKEELKGDVE